MNQKVMKNLAVFAVLLMVFSVIPSSAFAAESDTPDGGENAIGWCKHRIDGLFKGMHAYGLDIERPANVERLQFETEEDRIEFEKEKMIDLIDRQIERLNNIISDETDDDKIAAIEGFISQLNSIGDSIDAEDVTADELQEAGNDLREIMQDMLSSGICEPMVRTDGKVMERHANMERPQLTDEERIEFEKEKMIDLIDRQIERLGNIDVEGIDDETITADVIEEWINKLEEIKTSIDVDAITGDELQEAWDELHALMQEMISCGICEPMGKPMGKMMGHRFCSMEE